MSIDANEMPVSSLTDRLSRISNRATLMTLDALIGVVPDGRTGFLKAALTARTLADRITDNAAHFTGVDALGYR